MIKLIAADLDGTLLRDDKSLSPLFEALIDKLNSMGITFAFASGRTAPVLSRLYRNIFDKISAICSNGCVLLVNGETKHCACMPKDQLEMLIDLVNSTDGMEWMLDGEKGGYYASDNPNFLDLMDKYKLSPTKITSLEEAYEMDKIIKTYIYDEIDSLTHGLDALDHLKDRFTVVPSGDDWLDVMGKGMDKGSCLAVLQELLDVTPDETMCFGDYYNDLTLFDHASSSWAMKNAPEDVKSRAANVTKYDNNEDGVVRTIMEELNIEL